MSREQDSVAVLREMREDFAVAGRFVGRSRAEVAAALDEAIAALTREAAPQASGGDVVAELNAALGAVFAEDPAAAVRAHAAVSPIIRRLATTDSAIQSQQGATGGAVTETIQRELAALTPPDKMTESRAEYWKAGARACIAAVNRALAHPQAAGWSPVGVDAKDGARYRWLCKYPHLYCVNDLLKADQYVTVTRAVDALMACDAALGKERAE